MKRLLYAIATLCLCGILLGCQNESAVQIVTTTAPIYEFTTRICADTDLTVGCIVTENISCLHDYTLQTGQMRMIENAQTVVISGVGLEDFLADALSASRQIIDASNSVELLCSESSHEHNHGEIHHEEHDPHIWLSPANARIMAENICDELKQIYPQHADQFANNLQILLSELEELEIYGNAQLSSLSSRQLITFHDGFAYLADAFDLEILHAIEEESGSEASAAELIEICNIVNHNHINAIFTEVNGNTSAALIVASETDIPIYQLDMAMSGNGYFKTMYHNIDTLKEALG